ncbi:MAG: hypothetical protein BZY80_00820 [SAR202 cluster bacterium Io17-Chloro-G2]|nr:MAG: hypothetical protein BZY80_00820 [SAR202 cluster bacterium Io17-Chloro-G2]
MAPTGDPPKTFDLRALDGAERLDLFLAGQDLDLTRSQLRRLINQGHVLLNGQTAKGSQRVRTGDLVSLSVPAPRPSHVEPQWMPLRVVFQDDELVVIDKPAGLSVHPGPGHPDHTLVNALLALCPGIRGIGGEIRPGIVHRLDKDTSGLMMVAKSHAAHLNLSAQIKDRQVTKGYQALVSGVMEQDSGSIDAPVARDPRNRKRMAVAVGGREARTRYRVVQDMNAWSLLELYLETGRTHQIRVHLAYLGHPLYGDGVYGRASHSLNRHFLHAHHLGFRHPATGEAVEFRSELPQELALVMDGVRVAEASR